MILKKFGLTLFALVTLGILATSSVYPAAFARLLDLNTFFPKEGPFTSLHSHFAARVANHDWAFLAHVCGAMAALALGPFQFWVWLRERHPKIHRRIGYGYFFGILVGGTGGFLSAPTAWGGTAAQLGFALLAVSWMASSARGLSLILKGKVEEHQLWMKLSYAITLAGISLRIQMPLLYMAGLSETLVYQTVAWSCWAPQVVWWLTTKRQPVSPLRRQDAKFKKSIGKH